MLYQSKIIVSQNQDKDYLLKIINLDSQFVELYTISTEESSIGIKDVFEISEKIVKKSTDIKVFLILEANKLTLEAQNALLKVVEEPYNNSIIIFQTSNIDELIETIRSRCEVITDSKDFDDEDLNNIEFIFKDYLNLSFIEKTKLVENFLKSYSEKKYVKKAILAILNDIANNTNYISTLPKIEKAYKAVDINVGSKLIFDFISITLSK